MTLWLERRLLLLASRNKVEVRSKISLSHHCQQWLYHVMFVIVLLPVTYVDGCLADNVILWFCPTSLRQSSFMTCPKELRRPLTVLFLLDHLLFSVGPRFKQSGQKPPRLLVSAPLYDWLQLRFCILVSPLHEKASVRALWREGWDCTLRLWTRPRGWTANNLLVEGTILLKRDWDPPILVQRRKRVNFHRSQWNNHEHHMPIFIGRERTTNEEAEIQDTVFACHRACWLWRCVLNTWLQSQTFACTSATCISSFASWGVFVMILAFQHLGGLSATTICNLPPLRGTYSSSRTG